MDNSETMTPIFEQNLFARLADWQAEGLKTGLATLVGIDGSSPRPRGAQIVVAEDGRHAGVISSGCAEEAIIAQALEVVREAGHRCIRYGKNSPYLDIVLPCGSGLDVLFTGRDVAALTADVIALHTQRRAAHVTPDADGRLQVSADAQADSLLYPPDYRLHVFGAGPQFTGFARLAQLMGYELHLHSTDAASIDALEKAGLTVTGMTHRTRFKSEVFDEYSAIITLFHEHNLEIETLETALHSKAGFIGALGSHRTHKQRQDLLALRPPTPRPVSDIVGPIGLDIGAADPSEIALSIMAQIVATRRRTGT